MYYCKYCVDTCSGKSAPFPFADKVNLILGTAYYTRTSHERRHGPLVDAPDAALLVERLGHVDRTLVLGRPTGGSLDLRKKEGRGGRVVR